MKLITLSIFSYLIQSNRTGLHKSDNINKTITLTVIRPYLIFRPQLIFSPYLLFRLNLIFRPYLIFRLNLIFRHYLRPYIQAIYLFIPYNQAYLDLIFCPNFSALVWSYFSALFFGVFIGLILFHYIKILDHIFNSNFNFKY